MLRPYSHTTYLPTCCRVRVRVLRYGARTVQWRNGWNEKWQWSHSLCALVVAHWSSDFSFCDSMLDCRFRALTPVVSRGPFLLDEALLFSISTKEKKKECVLLCRTSTKAFSVYYHFIFSCFHHYNHNRPNSPPSPLAFCVFFERFFVRIVLFYFGGSVSILLLVPTAYRLPLDILYYNDYKPIFSNSNIIYLHVFIPNYPPPLVSFVVCLILWRLFPVPQPSHYHYYCWYYHFMDLYLAYVWEMCVCLCTHDTYIMRRKRNLYIYCMHANESLVAYKWAVVNIIYIGWRIARRMERKTDCRCCFDLSSCDVRWPSHMVQVLAQYLKYSTLHERTEN